MKRALCLLVLGPVLLSGCSSSSKKQAGTASPTPSPSASAPATPLQSPTTAVRASPTAAPFTPPKGTKVPAGFHPTSATFISATTGWVLGASPCPGGKGQCDVIARTLDGGRTWLAVPSPRTSPDRLAQIRYADERNGFVTGDSLWVTHDGGATWKPQAAPGGTLAAAAGRVWAATGHGLVSAPVGTAVFTQEAVTAEVASFSVHGDEVVFGTADAPGIQSVRHGAKPVDHASPCTDGQSPAPVEGTSTHWFVVCSGEAGLGRQEKTAYQSFDAGRTWKPAGAPPPQTGSDSYVTTDGIFVIDSQQVAVNRGSGWTTSLSTDGGLSEGGFESASLGYCIGGFGDSTTQTMKLTRDAGRTWSSVTF